MPADRTLPKSGTPCKLGANCKYHLQGVCAFSHAGAAPPARAAAAAVATHAPATPKLPLVEKQVKDDEGTVVAKVLASPPVALTKSQAAWFAKKLGIEFAHAEPTDALNCAPHGHPYVAIQRALAEQYVQSCVGSSVVLDVGGNPLRNRANGRMWHACCPVLVGDRDRNKRNRDTCGPPTVFNKWCEHKLQECGCLPRPDFLVFGHTAYYFTPDELLLHTAATQERCCYVIVHTFATATGTMDGPDGPEAVWAPHDRNPGWVVMAAKHNNRRYAHQRVDWIADGHYNGTGAAAGLSIEFTLKRVFGHTSVFVGHVGEAVAGAQPHSVSLAEVAASDGSPYGDVDLTSALTRNNLDKSIVDVKLIRSGRVYAVGDCVVASSDDLKTIAVPRALIAAAATFSVGLDRTRPDKFEAVVNLVKQRAKQLMIPAAAQPLAVVYAAELGFTATVEQEISAAANGHRNAVFMRRAEYHRDLHRVKVVYDWRFAVRAILVTACAATLLAGCAVAAHARYSAWRSEQNRQADAARRAVLAAECRANLTLTDHIFGATYEHCNTTGWFSSPLAELRRPPPAAMHLALGAAIEEWWPALTDATSDVKDLFDTTGRQWFCDQVEAGTWLDIGDMCLLDRLRRAEADLLARRRLAQWLATLALVSTAATLTLSLLCAWCCARRCLFRPPPASILATGMVASIDARNPPTPIDAYAVVGGPTTPGNPSSPPPERIAPAIGHNGAFAFNSNADNLDAALRGRFARPKMYVDEVHAAAYRLNIFALLPLLFPHQAVVEKLAEWLPKFPLHRQKLLLKADADVAGRKTRNTSGGFNKRENSGPLDADVKSLDEAALKVPRAIAPQPDERVVITGPVDSGFHTALKRSWPCPKISTPSVSTLEATSDPAHRSAVWYCSGTSSHVAGDNHRYHELAGHHIRETDGSRFDSAMNYATDAVEEMVYRYVYRDHAGEHDPDTTTDTAARLDRYFAEWNERSQCRGKTAYGQIYSAPFTRASGDTATTTRNSLTNALLTLDAAFQVSGYVARVDDAPDVQVAKLQCAWLVPPADTLAKVIELQNQAHASEDAGASTRYTIVIILLPPPPHPARCPPALAARWLDATHAAVHSATNIALMYRYTRPWEYELSPSGAPRSVSQCEYAHHNQLCILPPADAFHVVVTGDDSIAYVDESMAVAPHYHQLMDYHVARLGLQLKTVMHANFDNATFCSADFQRCDRDGADTFALRQMFHRLPRRGFAVDLPANMDRKSVVAGNVASTANADSGSPVHEGVAAGHSLHAAGAPPVFAHLRHERYALAPSHRASSVTPSWYAQIADRFSVGPDTLDGVAQSLATARPLGHTPDDDRLGQLLEEPDRGLVPPLTFTGAIMFAPWWEELVKLVSPHFALFETLSWLATSRYTYAAICTLCHYLFYLTPLFITNTQPSFQHHRHLALLFRYLFAVCAHSLWNYCVWQLPAACWRPAKAALEFFRKANNSTKFMLSRNARRTGARAVRATRRVDDRVLRGSRPQAVRRAQSSAPRRAPRPRAEPKPAARTGAGRSKASDGGAPRTALVENRARFLPAVVAAATAAGTTIAAAARRRAASAPPTRRLRPEDRLTRLPEKPTVAGTHGPWSLRSIAPAQPARASLDLKHVDTATPVTPAAVAAAPGAVASAKTGGVALANTNVKGEATTRQAEFHRYTSNGQLEVRRATLIENVELSSVVAGTSAFSATGTLVNPANALLTPWLAAVAQQFDEYAVEYLDVCFSTERATATNGRLYLAFDYECLDPTPPNRQQMDDLYGCVSGAVWDNVELKYRNNAANLSVYYTSTDTTPANAPDVRLDSPANLIVATVDCDDTKTLGEIRCKYGFYLFEPNLVDAASRGSTAAAVASVRFLNATTAGAVAQVPTVPDRGTVEFIAKIGASSVFTWTPPYTIAGSNYVTSAASYILLCEYSTGSLDTAPSGTPGWTTGGNVSVDATFLTAGLGSGGAIATQVGSTGAGAVGTILAFVKVKAGSSASQPFISFPGTTPVTGTYVVSYISSDFYVIAFSNPSPSLMERAVDNGDGSYNRVLYTLANFFGRPAVDVQRSVCAQPPRFALSSDMIDRADCKAPAQQPATTTTSSAAVAARDSDEKAPLSTGADYVVVKARPAASAAPSSGGPARLPTPFSVAKRQQ